MGQLGAFSPEHCAPLNGFRYAKTRFSSPGVGISGGGSTKGGKSPSMDDRPPKLDILTHDSKYTDATPRGENENNKSRLGGPLRLLLEKPHRQKRRATFSEGGIGRPTRLNQ